MESGLCRRKIERFRRNHELMRQICNISNTIGAIAIFGTFSFCIYQIMWNNDFFPFSSLLLFSVCGLVQIIGVGLSRKSPLYIYVPVSILNITNLGLFIWDFFDSTVLVELWNLNFSFFITIVFLSLIAAVQHLPKLTRRFVQMLLISNLVVILYFLFIGSLDAFLYEIIIISASINFIMVFVIVSFKYLRVKNLNIDKSQNQIDGEANSSIV
jgi:hypothetical protein